MKNIVYYIPGMALMLVALLIAAAPKLLLALVAAFIAVLLMTAGLGALYVGHLLKKSAER